MAGGPVRKSCGVDLVKELLPEQRGPRKPPLEVFARRSWGLCLHPGRTLQRVLVETESMV